MNEHERAAELIAALRDKGHGADEVHDSPVVAVNFWRDDQGRVPTATVWITPDLWAWGPEWQTVLPASLPAADVADQLVTS